MPILNGYRVAEYLTPVTVAASPVLLPWVETSGFTRVVGWYATAGGTSAPTIEYGTDGAAADGDFTPQVIPVGTVALDVLGPWMRVRFTQTVADQTKLKLYLQARA